MIRVIDSHVHFWDPRRLRYPWLDDLDLLNRAFLPGDLPTSGTGWVMDDLVFVQCDCIPEQGEQEVEWVMALAQQTARSITIVAFAPLEMGDRARPVLDRLRAYSPVRGVRRLIQSEPAGFSAQPDFVAGVKLLAEYGFSFDICIRHYQMADVLHLVRQCPDVRFVLDHIGKPDIKSGLLEPWRDQIAQLAAFPNVWCKISGLVTEADTQNWQPDSLHPYIEHVFEVFGMDRVMYGGDWPVVLLASSYERWMQTALQAAASLTDGEKSRFFADNARAFYRLG